MSSYGGYQQYGSNPYGSNQEDERYTSSNPYGSTGAYEEAPNPYGSSNPYGAATSNPYETSASNPYGDGAQGGETYLAHTGQQDIVSSLQHSTTFCSTD